MCKNKESDLLRAARAKIRKARVFDYCEHFPNFNFDPSEHFQYIQVMLEKLRKEESAEEDKLRSIKEDIEKYENDDDVKAELNYEGYNYMHHDALRANMQIAMLAPAIEGLYKKSLTILIKENLGEEKLSNYFNNHTNFKEGVEKGIMKALDELNIKSNFPSDTKNCLSILFDYRNALFHNGLEWEEKECEVFIKKYGESWFSWQARNRKLCFILPTRVFIDKVINFFADSIDSFAKSRQSLSENLKGKA